MTALMHLMTPCPTTPGHRCLHCAPPVKGRPFITDGLHNGNPFDVVVPLTPPAAAKPMADHFERVEVAREANHDGVVRIRQPQKKTSKTRSRKPSHSAIRDLIPVTFSF